MLFDNASPQEGHFCCQTIFMSAIIAGRLGLVPKRKEMLQLPVKISQQVHRLLRFMGL